MWSSLLRNHLSIFVTAWMSATLMPRSMASAIAWMRRSSGCFSRLSTSASFHSTAGRSKPCTSGFTMRTAFCSASSKRRPMLITSPTDFMQEPSSGLTRWNFFRSQRGTFTTQ